MSSTRHNITAIIYDKRGRVLSIGKNSYVKTHPLQYKHACAAGLPEKKFLHAEVHAIVKCKNLSKAYSIFISRYTKDGLPANAKPCKVCMSAIREAGIKVVEYTR